MKLCDFFSKKSLAAEKVIITKILKAVSSIAMRKPKELSNFFAFLRISDEAYAYIPKALNVTKVEIPEGYGYSNFYRCIGKKQRSYFSATTKYFLTLVDFDKLVEFVDPLLTYIMGELGGDKNIVPQGYHLTGAYKYDDSRKWYTTSTRTSRPPLAVLHKSTDNKILRIQVASIVELLRNMMSDACPLFWGMLSIPVLRKTIMTRVNTNIEDTINVILRTIGYKGYHEWFVMAKALFPYAEIIENMTETKMQKRIKTLAGTRTVIGTNEYGDRHVFDKNGLYTTTILKGKEIEVNNIKSTVGRKITKHKSRFFGFTYFTNKPEKKTPETPATDADTSSKEPKTVSDSLKDVKCRVAYVLKLLRLETFCPSEIKRLIYQYRDVSRRYAGLMV